MHWFLDWTGWQAFTAIATGVLAGTIFFAIRQMRQARRSTNAQLAVDLFRELRKEKVKKTLRKIYELEPEHVKRLSTSSNEEDKKLRDEIYGLLDKFEMLGGLVNRSIIDKPLAIEAYGGAPALRCWYCLVKFIRKEERYKRGFLLQNYEAFTRICLDYFAKEQIKVKFYKEDSSEAPIDLIQFFTGLEKGDERYPRKLRQIKKDRKKDTQGEV